jgi:flagellar basal body rod protein FlgG
VFFSSSLTAALDRIAERAADLRRAYTPGATPRYDDVAETKTSSDFVLDPLTVTPPEDVYFVTNDDRGQRSYTRNGAFVLRDGKLTDRDGRAIFGVAAQGAPPSELRIDPVDAALGRVRDAAIEPDGALVYRRDSVDPRSGAHEVQRVVVGRLALARFPAGTRLETDDGSHCAAPSGVVAEMGLAGEGTFAPLKSMRREHSRVDIDESLVRLKDAYIAFDALQAAEAAKAHLGKTAMDLLK